MIIFLNGASSVGKSVIARAIMRQSSRPFLYHSADHLLNFWIDEKFVALDSEAHEWIYKETEYHTRPLAHFIEGPHVAKLHWDLIDALSVLIQKGYDFIIDEVLWTPEVFLRYIPALAKGKSVYLVKVICDLIECERREKSRTDRYLGFARAKYADVYSAYPTYDLEINTTTLSVEDSARKIIEFTQTHKNPDAFSHALTQVITFESLQPQHVSFLQQWIHVSQLPSWVNMQTIFERRDHTLSISDLIVLCANVPIGYAQFFNAQDFQEEYHLSLPSLAIMRFYIGDTAFFEKDLEHCIIKQLLTQLILPQFSCVLTILSIKDKAMHAAYEKAGFTQMLVDEAADSVYLLYKN